MKPLMIGLGVVAIGITGAVVVYLGRKHTKINSEPGTWRCVGEVTKLYIYPMKSTRYTLIEEADTTEMGLMEARQDNLIKLRDRIFVVYKDDGEFVSARTYKDLFNITVEAASKDAVQMSYVNNDYVNNYKIVISIPSEYNGDKVLMRRGEKIPISDCGDEAAAWISKHILQKESGLRIGYWSDKIQGGRQLDQYFGLHFRFYPRLKNSYSGAYADLAAYQLMNESSVADLNSRLGDKVSELNFRPNIVIAGPKAYEEDHWDWVRIGNDAIFRVFRPCTRCSLTTVNPKTLEKDKNFEPLSTLKKYRLCENKDQLALEGKSPRLGMYMGLHKNGRIKIGDPVYVS